MSDAPPPPFWLDPRDRDPEVRKERVKLLIGALSAVGLALLIGSIVAPFIDPSRQIPIWRTFLGAIVGAAIVLAAAGLMRYIKPKE